MILIDENTLMSEIANGNEKAFSRLYERYFPEIHRYVLKFVKSEEHADDICQEIFIKIWAGRETLISINSFKAYIFIIARNHSFNFLKHAAVEKTIQHEISRSILELKNETEEEFQTAEYLRYLEMMLSQMSVRSREVFELCRENGNSYNETAEQLGISNNAVKKHMVKTMKLLKFSVRKEFGLSFTWIGLFSSVFAN